MAGALYKSRYKMQFIRSIRYIIAFIIACAIIFAGYRSFKKYEYTYYYNYYSHKVDRYRRIIKEDEAKADKYKNIDNELSRAYLFQVELERQSLRSYLENKKYYRERLSSLYQNSNK